MKLKSSIAHTFYSQKHLHSLEPIPFLKDRFWRDKGCGSRQFQTAGNPRSTDKPQLFGETRAIYHLRCARDWIWEHDEFPCRARTSPLVRLENALALHSRTISTKKYTFLNFEASPGRTKSCTTCHVQNPLQTAIRPCLRSLDRSGQKASTAGSLAYR